MGSNRDEGTARHPRALRYRAGSNKAMATLLLLLRGATVMRLRWRAATAKRLGSRLRLLEENFCGRRWSVLRGARASALHENRESLPCRWGLLQNYRAWANPGRARRRHRREILRRGRRSSGMTVKFGLGGGMGRLGEADRLNPHHLRPTTAQRVRHRAKEPTEARAMRPRFGGWRRKCCGYFPASARAFAR